MLYGLELLLQLPRLLPKLLAARGRNRVNYWLQKRNAAHRNKEWVTMKIIGWIFLPLNAFERFYAVTKWNNMEKRSSSIKLFYQWPISAFHFFPELPFIIIWVLIWNEKFKRTQNHCNQWTSFLPFRSLVALLVIYLQYQVFNTRY